MTMIQNTRPSPPAVGYSGTKGRFWSGHLNLLTSISLSCFGDISNVQFVQESTRVYRNGMLFAKKNGQFTI